MNAQSKFNCVSVRNGRWNVPNMTIKAHTAVGGGVIHNESFSSNEESGIKLFYLFIYYSDKN